MIIKKNLNVVVACSGRFHFFDQANQLHKLGLLKRLITDYPAFKVKQWGLPGDCLLTRPWRGAYGMIRFKSGMYLGANVQSYLTKSIHRGFARSIPSSLPSDVDMVICNSSSMLEAINPLSSKGVMTIVDHGSLHQMTERKIMIKECGQYGFMSFGNWQYQWLIDREQKEFEKADYILCCSRLAKKTMIENGCNESKIFVNNPGCDLSMFYPGEKKDDIFRVIFCGGINPLKGVHYLVRAYRELNLNNSELWIIGSGYEDSNFKQHISKYLNEDVIIKGSFPLNELRNLYIQGSVFILPSLSDGWGLVVLQAMACGIPVIVTDMAGASEVVEDGINGFVIKSRSVDAIKDKLLFLYENDELLTSMGEQAINTVKAGYSWDEYGKRLANTLKIFCTNNKL